MPKSLRRPRTAVDPRQVAAPGGSRRWRRDAIPVTSCRGGDVEESECLCGRHEEKDIGPHVVVAPAWFSAGHPRSHLVAAGPKNVRRGAGSRPFGEVVAPRVIGHDSAKRVARLTESAHGRK